MQRIKINFFKAGFGDCFLIEFNDFQKTTFLIDGGLAQEFKRNALNTVTEKFRKNRYNYIFLTHIDNDHISGIKAYFERYYSQEHSIKKVFYNTFASLLKFIPDECHAPYITINDISQSQTSVNQGVKLEQHLGEIAIEISEIIQAMDMVDIGDIRIIFLSPSAKNLSQYKTWLDQQNVAYTSSNINDYSKNLKELDNAEFEEDQSVTNVSSISMLIEYNNKRMLFLGDAVPSDIIKSLSELGYSKTNKLKLDVLKISHHGSKNNTSTELLEMIECNKFLISTDGHRYRHPDKETLARIVYTQNCPELIFNYNIYDNIFIDEEMSSGLFKISVQNEVII